MAYTDREALLKQIDESKPENWTNSDAEIQAEIDYAYYRGLVSTAPAADVVEVVHGKWDTTDTILGRCCICSVCGSCPTMEYRYCPYCGAKMDGRGK